MKNKEYRIHPNQKPVRLYEWILAKYSKDGDKVVDTHAGSGSCLVACHRMRRNWLGFELDPHYYKLADERIKAEQAQMTIYDFMED